MIAIATVNMHLISKKTENIFKDLYASMFSIGM